VGADNPRIQELRRRVQTDPASIAFAQLAEEYRRIGDYDEAVRVCRQGLARYPGYHSARVTLGRALVSLERLDEAKGEFEAVLQSAPDNLAAARGLDEISLRRGEPPLSSPVSASSLTSAPGERLFDLDALLEQLDERARQPASSPPPEQSEDPSIPEELLQTPPSEDPAPVTAIDDDSLRALEMSLEAYESARDAPDSDPQKAKVLSELESWLGAIVADRQRRSGT
jgi:tetratricopeptide (TPR) repeat protein